MEDIKKVLSHVRADAKSTSKTHSSSQNTETTINTLNTMLQKECKNYDIRFTQKELSLLVIKNPDYDLQMFMTLFKYMLLLKNRFFPGLAYVDAVIETTRQMFTEKNLVIDYYKYRINELKQEKANEKKYINSIYEQIDILKNRIDSIEQKIK